MEPRRRKAASQAYQAEPVPIAAGTSPRLAVEPLAPNRFGTGTELTAVPKPEDARQRLDALAKLLDKRVKQATDPGTRTGED
jgi:hypothetical protein